MMSLRDDGEWPNFAFVLVVLEEVVSRLDAWKCSLDKDSNVRFNQFRLSVPADA